MTITISAVVPVKDEAGNAGTLAREIAAGFAAAAIPADQGEIIFVDDGSTDDTVAELLALKSEIPTLRVIRHARNGGQSRAIRTGALAAHGSILVTLDGDGQNDPADIPALLAVLNRDSAIGLVSGVRAKRKDTFSRRLASRIGNGIRQRLLHDGAADTGCGLKAFRRDLFLSLPFFDHYHRYFITLTLREGAEVRFVPVNHRPRIAGRSKYTNFGRLLVSIQDLLGVMWLKRRHNGAIPTTEV